MRAGTLECRIEAQRTGTAGSAFGKADCRESLASRRKVSLSDLYADACRRMDITPEEALGCERFADRLRLVIATDRWVDFELAEDTESDRLVLGAVIES